VAAEPPSRNDGVTIRSCPTCGQDFERSGRRRHCSDACRQAAWRRRHAPLPPEPPVPPKGAKRAVTVYICDNCGTRTLGAQRCDTCNTFMRAAGLGGPCPCCDEPIAVAELLQGGEC
jgi:hypothetical protein